MSLDYRKANISAELLQATVNNLIHSLAVAIEEREALKAENEKLKEQLSPKPAATS